MQSKIPNKYGIVRSSLFVASTSATKSFLRSQIKNNIGRRKEKRKAIDRARI
jgi:hypothetical protein